MEQESNNGGEDVMAISLHTSRVSAPSPETAKQLQEEMHNVAVEAGKTLAASAKHTPHTQDTEQAQAHVSAPHSTDEKEQEMDTAKEQKQETAQESSRANANSGGLDAYNPTGLTYRQQLALIKRMEEDATMSEEQLQAEIKSQVLRSSGGTTVESDDSMEEESEEESRRRRRAGKKRAKTQNEGERGGRRSTAAEMAAKVGKPKYQAKGVIQKDGVWYLQVGARLIELPQYETWSNAKSKALDCITSNPNAFFYRHTTDSQLTGKWTVEEMHYFIELLQTNPPDNHWGLFAMNVPGRVGYQCRNFYHQLLSQGVLQDPDYLDDNGQYIAKKRRDRPKNAPHKIVVTDKAMEIAREVESKPAAERKRLEEDLQRRIRTKQAFWKSLFASDKDEEEEETHAQEEKGKAKQQEVIVIGRAARQRRRHHSTDGERRSSSSSSNSNNNKEGKGSRRRSRRTRSRRSSMDEQEDEEDEDEDEDALTETEDEMAMESVGRRRGRRSMTVASEGEDEEEEDKDEDNDEQMMTTTAQESASRTDEKVPVPVMHEVEMETVASPRGQKQPNKQKQGKQSKQGGKKKQQKEKKAKGSPSNSGRKRKETHQEEVETLDASSVSRQQGETTNDDRMAVAHSVESAHKKQRVGRTNNNSKAKLAREEKDSGMFELANLSEENSQVTIPVPVVAEVASKPMSSGTRPVKFARIRGVDSPPRDRNGMVVEVEARTPSNLGSHALFHSHDTVATTVPAVSRSSSSSSSSRARPSLQATQAVENLQAAQGKDRAYLEAQYEMRCQRLLSMFESEMQREAAMEGLQTSKQSHAEKQSKWQSKMAPFSALVMAAQSFDPRPQISESVELKLRRKFHDLVHELMYRFNDEVDTVYAMHKQQMQLVFRQYGVTLPVDGYVTRLALTLPEALASVLEGA